MAATDPIEISDDATLLAALDAMHAAAARWRDLHPLCEPRLDLGSESYRILGVLAGREGIVDVDAMLDGYCHAAGVRRWTVDGVERGGKPRAHP